jgi:hypothetical protein
MIPKMKPNEIEIKNPKGTVLISGLIVFFFIGGIVNHALPFAGMTSDGRSPIWHGFNTLLALSGIFSVLSGRQLAWCWLVTLFLAQTSVELRGVFLSVGQSFFANQVIETGLNLTGLIFLWLSRGRYRN